MVYRVDQSSFSKVKKKWTEFNFGGGIPNFRPFANDCFSFKDRFTLAKMKNTLSTSRGSLKLSYQK